MFADPPIRNSPDILAFEIVYEILWLFGKNMPPSSTD
jgi:hypothetical protein